jgi:hypothetical protein
MNIPKYVSAEAYSKQSGLGVEEVKRLCRTGEIKCLRTEKGYYKIPVYQDSVPIEEHLKLKEENIRLKMAISSMVNIGQQI